MRQRWKRPGQASELAQNRKEGGHSLLYRRGGLLRCIFYLRSVLLSSDDCTMLAAGMNGPVIVIDMKEVLARLIFRQGKPLACVWS